MRKLFGKLEEGQKYSDYLFGYSVSIHLKDEGLFVNPFTVYNYIFYFSPSRNLVFSFNLVYIKKPNF